MLDAPRHDVAVLGGGISGLVAAYHLAKRGSRVVLLEKAEATGGVIQTELKSGWLLELGPNSLSYHQGDDIDLFLKDLGLDDELTTRPMREHDRYIWRQGELRRVPVSPLQLLRRSAISRRTLTRAGLGVFKPHRIPKDDVSVGAYFSPILGRQAVEQLLAPALAGIYAADPFSLSLEAVMPKLHRAAQQSRSLAHAMRTMKKDGPAGGAAKGSRVLASFTGGMATLPRRLTEKITGAGGRVITGFEATSVVRESEGGWILTDTDGRQVKAKRLICALPAAAAAELLKDALPELCGLMRHFRYASMAVAHVGVRENEVGVAHGGFGYLAAREPGLRCLGMIWSDRIFEGRAPAGHRLFTVFLGGNIDPAAVGLSQTELLEEAFKDLRRVMKWRGESPVHSNVTRWPQALPLLEVGHPARVREVLKLLPGDLQLAGNYVTGVSLPSCIRAGKTIAEGALP